MSAREPVNLATEVHADVPGAVERLVRAYQDGLFSYALGLLQDPFDAQEIVQDTFLRAHTTLTARYDAERCRNLALRPWLYRITRNLARNRRRSRRARPDIALEPALLVQASDAVLGSASGRSDATVQARDSLERGFGRLARTARELLLLRFVDGLSYAEISAILGTTEASARGRVFRATRRLRVVLMEVEGGDAL